MHIIALVIGDWSHDGHSKVKEIHCESNLDTIELHKAYREGVKLIGFEFSAKVCIDYEDNSISEQVINLLNSFGGNFNPDLSYLEHEEYADMWIFIAKLGNPDLKVNIINKKKINIGGYGLFF